jgi:hypothetical protein
VAYIEDCVVDGIASVTCDSWKDFVTFIQDRLLKYRQYIFRGQRDASWKLTPSLYRSNFMSIFFADPLQSFKEASRIT